MEARDEALDDHLAQAQQGGAEQDHGVAQEVGGGAPGEALGEHPEDAGEGEDHAEHHAGREPVPRDQQVGEGGGEEGIGGDHHDGAARSGVVGADVEGGDLGDEEQGEAEEGAQLPRSQVHRLPGDGGGDGDHRPADGEAGGAEGQGRQALQAGLDGDLVAAPEDGGQQRQGGGAGTDVVDAVAGQTGPATRSWRSGWRRDSGSSCRGRRRPPRRCAAGWRPACCRTRR